MLVLRHPAHVRAGLLQAKVDHFREMPAPDNVLERLEVAYKQSAKRYDAVFFYEELVWNRVTTAEKLRSALGFDESQVKHRTILFIP